MSSVQVNHFKTMIHWQFITCIQFPKRVWTDEVFWKIGWKKERSVQAQTLIHTHAHTCPVTPHPHPHNQNTYTLHQKHQHLIHSQANILTAHQHPAKWHMHTERCSIHTWLPSLMNKWNDQSGWDDGRVWASLTLLIKRIFLLSLALSPVSVTFVKAIWHEKLFK